MAEIINLRRARKAKARDAKDAQAQAARTAHGVAKSTRALAKAQRDKDARNVDGAKLDD